MSCCETDVSKRAKLAFKTVGYSPRVSRVSIATWRSSSSAESQSATTALMLSSAYEQKHSVLNVLHRSRGKKNKQLNLRSNEPVRILNSGRKREQTLTPMNCFSIIFTPQLLICNYFIIEFLSTAKA